MSMESHGQMVFTGENGRTQREPCPSATCPPQIPHGLTQARTRASAVRGRRLTAWAMARIYRHFRLPFPHHTSTWPLPVLIRDFRGLSTKFPFHRFSVVLLPFITTHTSHSIPSSFFPVSPIPLTTIPLQTTYTLTGLIFNLEVEHIPSNYWHNQPDYTASQATRPQFKL
jgi:hypothetical protein